MSARFDVRNVGTEWEPIYVTEHDGVEHRATNPSGLDSLLTDAGAPAPRDLCLIENGDDR